MQDVRPTDRKVTQTYKNSIIMKSKIIFGRAGLKVPTPLLVKALMKWAKRVCLALSISSTIAAHEMWAMGLVCLAWFFDELEPLFGVAAENKPEVEIKPQGSPQEGGL